MKVLFEVHVYLDISKLYLLSLPTPRRKPRLVSSPGYWKCWIVPQKGVWGYGWHWDLGTPVPILVHTAATSES